MIERTPQEIVDAYNAACPGTLMETLGIEYTHAEPATGTLVATMPVGPQVYQPMQILHGGATVALAESVGSAASLMLINPQKEAAVGAEISANHLKSARTGRLIATATCVHKGRSSHLFHIKVENEQGELISMVKLLNFIKQRK